VRCGSLQDANAQCQGCGNKELAPVFRVTATQVRTFSNGNQVLKHDKTCPACGTDNDPILLGIRNTTLGAVTVEQTWASPYNDDKKLIAFSDSVQDAAHRAGFFSARTYLNTVRIGLTKIIDSFAHNEIAWPVFLERTTKAWFDPNFGLKMEPERFVSEFIGPNMTWQRDWAEELLAKGKLPSRSRLPERVAKRLRWQAFAEFTYIGRRGRNLETLGKAVLAPDVSVVEKVAEQLVPILQEQFGLRHLDKSRVFQWIWGIVTQMKLRGGVADSEMENYMRDGRFKGFYFAPMRKEWLPAMGLRTSHPRFLVDGELVDHDRIGPRNNVRSFYEGWTSQLLSEGGLIPDGGEIEICRKALESLVANGLVIKVDASGVQSFGLNPDKLILSKNPARIISSQGRRTMVVPASIADRLLGMPCMQAMSETYTARSDEAHWLAEQFGRADLRRVYSAEHTGLLDREQREALEERFKQRKPKPWYENLLSATPTLEMGVDIGDLSSVMLCSVPPNQASYLQRVGRAGRVDGNAFASTLADGASPHDLYFFEDTLEMLAGEVTSPGIFLKAPEVLRRQLFAFSLDDWVGTCIDESTLPDKTKEALDARDAADQSKFPFTFLSHVQAHESQLLESFKSLLSPDLDPRVEDRLLAFMMGTEQEDSLKIRLTKLLDELSKERKTHKERAESIAKKLRELATRPQDEATTDEQDNLERERQKALELAKEINQRDLLNAMTDAGLIPNYAFPEAGIELKSLLWRKRGVDDPAGPRNVVSLPAQRYERPANSALSEFAPENVFYANQRKVEIDQINLQLSSVESWRLCPTCQHMNNETVMPDTSGVCPSCGDPMWANVAQVRDLLRFRQAIATSDDTRVRIDDSDDDREPKFYVRQLITDFKPDDIELAYKVSSVETPFGFEFVQKVTFRDVNFGEAGRGNEAYSVAGVERNRPGFELCRHCGKVQPEFELDPQHSFDCPQKDEPADQTMIRCLYLYREFSSEALRILVPYTRSGVDETSVESFMAALRVGLKQRFGGKVDHLRLMIQDEKPRDGGATRHYVVLYDSVPGGTGYLRELLADKAKTLIDVIRLALEKLRTCACNSHPEKDGCYRCVYQHRLGKAMNLISRNRARDILESLSVSLDSLIEVKSVTDIYVNPNFDSELEARFIEGLRRLGGKEGLPRVELIQEIVRGKSGFLITVGEQRYWIEPQAELGPSDGVSIHCKPDFLFRPVAGGGKRKPIAVFCDGWTFHKEIARIDAKKRNSILASGAFWTYSVTWEDVKAAMDEKVDNDLTDGLTNEAYVPAIIENPSISSLKYDAWDGRNSMATLIRWLGAATSENGDPHVVRQAKHAYYLSAKVVPHPEDFAHEHRRTNLMSFWGRLSDLPCPVPVNNTKPAGNVDASAFKLRYNWPLVSLLKDNGELKVSPGFLVLDRSAANDEKEYHVAWRRWLRLFNLFQTLPGVYLTTSDGLEAGDYQAISRLSNPLFIPDVNGVSAGTGWDSVFRLALSELHDEIKNLRTLGVPAPDEMGYELAESGQVVAEAEMVWLKPKVALLLSDSESGEPFRKNGWKTVECGPGWAANIAEILK
jgi:DEAD/DEAH box helicase domain-containing protein